MKELEYIWLRMTAITGVGIKHLVQSLPKLKRLKLEHCEKISTDAIVWARSRGIEVSVVLTTRRR